MSSKKIIWPILFFLLIFTRFFGFQWGNGFLFHPDENNMARSVSQMTDSNLNPHFFAYGQFPLYLAHFTQTIFDISPSDTNSTYVLRFWSAFFSVLTILLLYKIYPSKIFFLLLVFTPGLIQISHFGTTESLLLLIFVSIIYLSLKKHYLWAAIIGGIGISTKISALIFIFPLLISILKNRKYLYLLYIFPLIIISAIVFSPYSLIEFSDFISALKYETAVANGSLPIFYTQQFVNTIPYLFQLTKIFPYAVGLPMLFLSIFGLKYIKKYPLIFLSGFVYFLYFGQVFVKWTRFMSPLFFIFPLLTSLYLIKQQPVIRYVLFFICIIPGLIFFSQYFRPDIRVSATDWINQNLSPQSSILSESGNVVNLPLNSQVTNYDFYNLPSPNPLLYDYVLVPSRRVFKNNFHPEYYHQLFNNFQLLAKFSPPTEFFLDSENAEETWSVFDHPTIRLFTK